MHDLPRQLSADDLAALFEGRSRFVERLAALANPLAEARRLLRSLPEEEVIEALAAHPRIGERAASHASAREQGSDEDPDVLADLASLNRAYEEKFGFRFVVFVNRRPKAEILEVLRARLARSREEELQMAIDDLVAIAEDRYRPTGGAASR
ncbi:MAG: 2-oxo-4-hydroxy-4-carboxy-5-ureidoimidazoline decarboxylase [Armatimonadetes bacterium]|nr:2-oxo-4-hydroxy-4-carboxy-5-ureidoimidazoline decarboxylase [Armatimonadota bacterium]